jgi:hypothetical protein
MENKKQLEVIYNLICSKTDETANLELLKKLIETENIDLNKIRFNTNRIDFSILQLAIALFKPKIIEYIIDTCPELMKYNSRGTTKIYKYSYLKVMTFTYLENPFIMFMNALINTKESLFLDNQHIAQKLFEGCDKIELVRYYGINYDETQHYSMSIFDVLFEDFNKNIDIIIFLLEKYTPDKINEKYYLHIVIVEIIKINNQYLHNGHGALHYIVKLRPYLKVIELLIKNGANINTFKDGYTPLDLAIFANIKFIINLLITKYGANINLQDSNGDTLLYKIINKRGNFPYDYYDGGYDFDLGESYSFQHCKKLIKLKKKYNFDIDICNNSGYTPLHIAILKDNEKIIKLLMDNGANIESVLEKERENDNTKIIERILEIFKDY